MKTFEERYPEHDNPEWQILTGSQEEDLERARSEHEAFIMEFNDAMKIEYYNDLRNG